MTRYAIITFEDFREIHDWVEFRLNYPSFVKTGPLFGANDKFLILFDFGNEEDTLAFSLKFKCLDQYD